MRVFCKTAFLAAIVSTLACHDAAGPAAIRAQFALDNIDGRPLPTYPAATPGLTPTILSSTLTLGNDGHASITEHQTEFDGTDVTHTTNYTYVIARSEIQFDYDPPCPPNALCAAPPKGTILWPRISLEMGRVNTDVIHYNFLLTN